MGAFVKGDVLVMPFPYSDLSAHKRRPVLVLAVLPGHDLIVCQITSQVRADHFSIPLRDADFAAGGLKQASLIRAGRIFTA